MPVTHLWAGCGLQISEVQPFGGFHKCILVANFCSLGYGTESNTWLLLHGNLGSHPTSG